ncbi:MAG: heme-binding domain-containing protein [Chloroflexi bacterium]|nr:heme-binding domain-containing protein [Chloroflexota bacterium]
MVKRIARIGLGLLVVVLLGIQLVPYGRSHANPPVRAEPAWNSPQTRRLAVRACYDCHSNETTWPWYSNIAPVSWLVQQDVDEGRRDLNFSEWDGPQEEAGEAADAVRKGTMPPSYYSLIHPQARLTPAETQALIRALEATLGTEKTNRR